MHIFIIYFHNALDHFYLSYFHELYLASTLTNIFCIVRDFSALGITRKIQITGSLQVDDLFTIDSWV